MDQIETKTIAKVVRRFLPILIVSFILSFLDRVNVGFAALTMSKDLGFSGTIFGLGAGLFFISYFLLEVPYNMILERVGARLWMFRIMVTWGIIAAATAFVWNAWSFYVIRLLLGAAEAGFFPGVAFFLTLWLPIRHRARIIALFMAAMPFANVIGGPVSGYLLSINGLFGLRGWQLLYIVEGLPSVFVAFLLLFLLRDTPGKAEWLEPEERAWLERELKYEREHTTVLVKHGLSNIFSSSVIFRLCLVYFGIVGFNFGLSFFVPQIVRDFGLSFVQTGFVSAIPFLIAGVGMIVWGRHSDKRNERKLHILLPMCFAAIGLGGATLVSVPIIKLALLCLASFGVFSALPIFWTLMPTMLSPAAAAVAIAVVNSFGNLSGFTAPFAVGALKDVTGSVNAGLQLVALYGIVAITILAHLIRRQQKVAAESNSGVQLA
jgi:MFS family permease